MRAMILDEAGVIQNIIVVNHLDDMPGYIEAPIGAAIGLTLAQIAERAAQIAEKQKDSQAEAELGSDAIRVIVETIVPMIQDGSITTATPAQIIAQAKANRRAEL